MESLHPFAPRCGRAAGAARAPGEQQEHSGPQPHHAALAVTGEVQPTSGGFAVVGRQPGGPTRMAGTPVLEPEGPGPVLAPGPTR
jgi:hypothetical protein